jgi:hypothetical protein
MGTANERFRVLDRDALFHALQYDSVFSDNGLFAHPCFRGILVPLIRHAAVSLVRIKIEPVRQRRDCTPLSNISHTA